MDLLNIIYIEDNSADASLTIRTLKKAGFLFDIVVIDSERAFIKALESSTPDLILSDHSLPGFNSIEAFKIARAKLPDVPFILLTGSVSEEFAVECLLAGIDDYILKSNLIRLPSSIERVLSKRKIVQEKELIESLHAKLQKSYKVIEIKNKEIIDSINYASRIQNAILPQESRFMEDFYSGFCIFLPCNIVSGDFYWLATTTTTDGTDLTLKVLAAADCTGHGVPGAFMSLLVSELLNQTLKNKDINSPADVLTYLNKKLPYSLNKNHRERVNDGLDIALCAVDIENRVLYFSGANRPVWIVRRNENTFELIEIKGTKASISANTPSDQIFNNETIQLFKGDRVFVFTDGITDQFGGKSLKKMGRQKLKDVLLESSNIEMSLQKKYLLNFILEWKGGQEQIDDMLLIGIEIN